MSNLQHRQTKIQDKRKQTPRRDFVMEICSWFPVMLYKRNNLVSIYPPNINFPIIECIQRENMRDSLTQNGQEADIDKPLLMQRYDLLQRTGFPHNFLRGKTENADYGYIMVDSKNAYLSYELVDAENVAYSMSIKGNCRNIFNSTSVIDTCENVYYGTGVTRSYNIFYSNYIHGCSNLWFCKNMQGCQECILCKDLTNQSYCINNQPLSKEKYLQEKEKILQNKHKYDERCNSLKGSTTNFASNEVVGRYITKSQKVEDGYFVYEMRNAKNCVFTGSPHGTSNFFDVARAGFPHGDYFYGVLGAGGGQHYYMSSEIMWCDNIYYSYFLEHCSFCLGCIGLKNKSYCILNKQYGKEERYEKVDEIFGQMEADGTLGQFFPASMNPFYFNDTVAYLIDQSFSREEVIAKGYLRRDEPIKVDIPEGAEVVNTSELGQYEGFENGEWKINRDILKKIIQDPEGNIYRIVPMEYDFLMKYGLPLPRKHRLDRMKENFTIV